MTTKENKEVEMATTFEDLKRAVMSLSQDDIIRLDEEIHRYAETFAIMTASETAFSEWLDSEEDIYNDI